jgi:dipeptidyl aminopeptidase/acylaminoacyl peptidase
MAEPQTAPYGSWKSPITASLVATSSRGFAGIALRGETIYFGEAHPSEGGRIVVVQRDPDGRRTDATPQGYNVRTRVHEYGGMSFAVDGDTVYFSNFADQRLYRQDRGALPTPITPEAPLRYAEPIVDRQRNRLICVREDHRESDIQAVNALVAVAPDGDDAGGTVLVSGNDFYSSQRLSPDGTRLAWLTWNHPNMPWDGTELWTADVLPDGALANSQRVAGGREESIFQPEWSPDGVLHFVSDRTGWWNLYRWRDGQIEPLYPMEAEFGSPQWAFGMSTYGFTSAVELICAYTSQGVWRLAHLNTSTGQLTPIETPYTVIASLRSNARQAVFIGASPTRSSSLVRLDLASGETKVVRASSDAQIDARYFSVPQAIEFPTEHGLTAHAFYYPPTNPDIEAPPGEKPPLLVFTHGGPTSATQAALSLAYQFWTSRGFGVVDVNYGGSTGFGRPYRQRLNGQWGVVDLDDCVNVARYLVQQGLADPRRLAIRGGSAGGYTTLCALTFRDTFTAGASLFGVSDLEALAKETHKFESRYMDSMIGPFPEAREVYLERSPIHFADRLHTPVIFFQGLDDKVVLPNQAEVMVEALRKKGVPVAYLPFEGEGHGFRRAENIQRTLEAELYFYSRIFSFPLADEFEPVPIENL